MTRYHNFIDGAASPADTYFDVINPADSSVVGQCPCGTTNQMDDAIAAAGRAFRIWSITDDATRKAACIAVAEVLEENAEELAQILTAEQGKPLGGLGSRFELGGAAVWARTTGALELPVKIIQDNNEGRIELHRKPIGVVGSITPWNFPITIAIWHIMPAIRAGNTVVIKPSPYTPLTTLRMVELANGVLPKGVLNVVAGEDHLGAQMSAHPGIRKMVFTGSTETGKKVMGSAASNLKKLTLELGGNDAGIVLPDCDPGEIAEGLFWGAFVNNGQTCAAMKRTYVHEDIYEEVCAAVIAVAKGIKVGPGNEPDTILGPVQNKMQLEKVRSLLAAAVEQGAEILYQGEVPEGGNFHPVTIVGNINDGNPLVDQEQFGPIMPIIRYSDVDEAIANANRLEVGLGGSIWSKDLDRAKTLALRLESGTAWINRHGPLNPMAPFAGVKQSGIGVEFGEEGLAENTDIQVVHL
ncbi:aldehyde dehydrogenase family protein [uncultured Ruegeria sp.]|uniref:aldehyde dehydrogenase family protein n=1 Tax=uncultured Ruegeria sp. TaxID=259304 RepID=UPI00260223C9|nr:aldehyde dehydrogenase family protein [uncultured Ruegeria sp.]